MGGAELREADPAVIAQLESKLVAPDTSLPEKYRVLFSLRNVSGSEAQHALHKGEASAAACNAESK